MDGIQEEEGGRMFKVRAYTHFAALLSLLIVTIVFVAILIYLKFDLGAVKIFGFFFLIDAAPALYLHSTYYEKNKNEEYEIRAKELILLKGGKETVYKNKDIEKIIIYLSPALYKNSNFHLLSIESYHFAEVKLKTGEELVLTCLLHPRLDKSLKIMQGVLFEKRKRLFCMI